MTHRDALDYIYSFTNFEVTPAGDYSSKTFDLTRMERLLAALGDPHRQFRSVHVAVKPAGPPPITTTGK